MIPLTDQQLHDFQTALAWKTGAALPDGRTLGVPGKRGNVTAGTDPRVRLVLERLQPADKTVVEFGSCEGIHTVQLAGVCKSIVGLEVRPHNVACALARLFVHDVRNARLELRDVRDADARLGTFDIAFHVGVLYHLTDPVSHLARVAGMAPDLVLDTHYATDDLGWPRTELAWGGKTYRGRVYREGGWAEVFSGVEPTAVWLYRDDLLQLLRDVGYDTVEVTDDRRERNGPRFTVLARQSARAVRREPATDPRTAIERTLLAAWDAADRARTEAEALRQTNAQLRAELDALRRSWSWRVGTLAVAPLRTVKRLRRKAG